MTFTLFHRFCGKILRSIAFQQKTNPHLIISIESELFRQNNTCLWRFPEFFDQKRWH